MITAVNSIGILTSLRVEDESLPIEDRVFITINGERVEDEHPAVTDAMRNRLAEERKRVRAYDLYTR